MTSIVGTWQIIETNMPDFPIEERVFYHFGIDGWYRRISPYHPKKSGDPVAFAVLKYTVSKEYIIFKSRSDKHLWSTKFNFENFHLIMINDGGYHSVFQKVTAAEIPEEAKKYIDYKMPVATEITEGLQ
jgi:hypothetical protein